MRPYTHQTRPEIPAGFGYWVGAAVLVGVALVLLAIWVLS
jgi:hypothetical protein